MSPFKHFHRFRVVTVCAFSASIVLLGAEALARQNIRSAFFDVYPGAVDTVLDTVPSHPAHCGACHYDFSGGGTRNPYGLALEAALPGFPNNPNGRQQAVLSIELQDPDGDGFSTVTEVTDLLTFLNTPTMPGLTPANLSDVLNVAPEDIQDFLVPSTTIDTEPPDVTLISPNGGEVFTGNSAVTVEWSASDPGGIAGISLYLSDNGGADFHPIAMNLANSGTHTWFPANRPGNSAVMRVAATDNAFNVGLDETDAMFSIVSPIGGRVPTTLRDFDQPGSQPFEAGTLNDPVACIVCHGNYDAAVEPAFNWMGSMMSQASRDPLFEASMVISNQDAPDAGDLCLRCHFPRGWLGGRSVPTDGSQMLVADHAGVSCDYCHRMVDPFYDPVENPAEDAGILAGLSAPPVDIANGMYIVDPTGARRGPFVDADGGHAILVSPFHREAALCGTCHDVSNPAFENDGSGNFVANAMDTPANQFASHTLLPIERTYSEWFYSEYNTPGGVHAPEFGGNSDFVATCQDCHMRDVTGQGCNFGAPPIRDDLPLHDMTGGSTWLPGLLADLYPGEVDAAALQAGIDRARYMLQNAAELDVGLDGPTLEVTVTNQTGHKLPTGYPEGRRMWLHVAFFDTNQTLLTESGVYDNATGVLLMDPGIKIYEVKPGLDEDLATALGLPSGPSFHFVLNNKVFKDNRIPPRGFTNANFAWFGGQPVGTTYDDGQYWDETTYAIPPGAASAEVTLYYQSTSKEFVEFLRDENVTNSKGQEMFDLWNDNGKCPPEVMASTTIPIPCVDPCSDDDPCTIDDACTDDACLGTAVDCSAAADDCNVASCDAAGADGNCAILTPANEGEACDGGTGTCVNGICQTGTACLAVADCADLDEDSIRDSACVWWNCVDGVCQSTDVPFADMGGPNGVCPPDGFADGNDRFHALNCFSNRNTLGLAGYPCESAAPLALNVDAGGEFGHCSPDGVCDGHDAFHALNTFQGLSTCSCPSGPAPSQPQDAPVVGSALLQLLPRNTVVRPGDLAVIDVMLSGVLADLRGYQLHLDAVGTDRRHLDLVDISIEKRADSAFADQADWQAFNVHTAQLLAGRDGPGVSVQSGSYLGTFTFQVGKHAEGSIKVALLADHTNRAHRTFLFPTSPDARIQVSCTPLRLQVMRPRARIARFQ